MLFATTVLGPSDPVAWIGAAFADQLLLYGFTWLLVRASTTLDVSTATVQTRFGSRELGPVRGWGRTPRTGWVSVREGTGERVIYTDPEDAEGLYDALAAVAGTEEHVFERPDGFSAYVPGVRAVSGGRFAPFLSVVRWGTLGALLGTAAVRFGDVSLLGMLAVALVLLASPFLVLAAASWGLASARSPSRRVEVVGTTLRVRGLGARLSLNLRGAVSCELTHGPSGAVLVVTSADGALRIWGQTSALEGVRTRILAVRPSEGERADLPEALAFARAAAREPT